MLIGSDLIEHLRGEARSCASSDPAHDWLHVTRVERLAQTVAAREGAESSIVRAAAILHELFSYPKNHPLSRHSGERCAELALEVMRRVNVPREAADSVAYCIRVHPFSAGVVPETLEARVLQDADRLDAIGAIGVARCFATCAAMSRPFYDPVDPFAGDRTLDDNQFGLDHVFQKLLRIPDRLHTVTARHMASDRVGFLESFLEQLKRELGAPGEGVEP